MLPAASGRSATKKSRQYWRRLPKWRKQENLNHTRPATTSTVHIRTRNGWGRNSPTPTGFIAPKRSRFSQLVFLANFPQHSGRGGSRCVSHPPPSAWISNTALARRLPKMLTLRLQRFSGWKESCLHIYIGGIMQIKKRTLGSSGLEITKVG